MSRLGDLKETKETLDKLRNERQVFDMLHQFYISALRGGFYEYITLCSIDLFALSSAWSELQFYIDDIYDLELISERERDDLVRFINDTYLKSCDKILTKGGKPNGKSERRCDVNSRCNTSRNGRRTSKSETDGNDNDE